MATKAEDLQLGSYKFGWHDESKPVFEPKKGLSADVVAEISDLKDEPKWMRDLRLKAYRQFEARPMPNWGADLSGIDFNNIYYFIRSTEKQANSWEDLPEDIRNTYDRLGIPDAEKQRLVAGVAAQYECLRGDTRVYTTTRGPIPIKEIEPGEMVFSFNEDTGAIEPARVKAAAQTDVRQTYEVVVGGRHSRTIHATDNHPVLTLEDARKPDRIRARYARRWKTVGELVPGDLVAVARDLPEFGTSREFRRDGVPERFPVRTSPDLLWLLGYWLGDGCTRNDPARRTYRVELAAPAEDAAVQAEITRVVSELFGLRVTTPDRWRVAVNSKALVDWLADNALIGNAHTKRVPRWVYALPTAERLAFLGGYVDADGYVSPDGHGNGVTVTSTSTALLTDVAELAAVCGLRPSGPYRFESKHPHDPQRTIVGHRLALSGDVERLDVRNPKRRERLGRRAYRHSETSARGTTFRSHTTDTLGFARVKSIKAADIAPVYDIEIDGPHNFVAEGIVVHNSEVVYHKIAEDLEAQGVIFLDTDTALREHEDLFREHFTKVIPPNDNKLAALNTAVWSGGSFIWIPEGVKVDIPLQAYFRINQQNMGQFERTLIIAEPGSYVHYVEGCTAPIYSSDSLHSAVVELIAKPGSRLRYTTIQNWSNNVYNLVTKRAAAYEDATVEWIDGNIGCLAEGSTVTTRGGVKPIEEVTPGEEVLAYDQQSEELCFRRVTAKRDSGRQPVRKVRVGERRLRVTDNHPFFSWTYNGELAKKLGRYQLSYVRADQLSQAIVPRASIDYGEPHKLELPETTTTFRGGNQYAEAFDSVRRRAPRLIVNEQTTDDLMWLFGLFVGDGSLDVAAAANGGLRFGKVVFSVPRDDRARPRLVEVVGGLLPGVRPTERRDGVTLTWNSVELVRLFEDNGFVTGAHNKRLPDWLVSLPESQRLAFVAGVLDSDGCAPRSRRAFNVKSVNRELLGDVAEVLTTLGIPARLYTEFDEERRQVVVDRECTARGAHRLEFPLDPRLVAAVSEPLRVSALADAPAEKRHFRNVGRSNIVLPDCVEVRKVEVSEPIETVQTWDIEVEGTGNFVSEGFIVHNSKITMKYPSVHLMGRGAKGEVLSVAFAGDGQHQDAGAKMIHHAPDTSSNIVSKSVAQGTGRTSYRGQVAINEGAHRVKSNVVCDALLLDEHARSDTYPYMNIEEEDAQIGHEASVSKIGEEQLFYMQSRGIEEFEAMAMIVRGFIEPISKELPMEYSVELNRLISLNMEGSVG